MKKNRSMERLWAPWRARYIQHIGRIKGCVFCKRLGERRDAKNFIVTRTRYSFAVLNIFPYNNGHVMVMPKRHTNSFRGMTQAEKCDLLDLIDDMKGRLSYTLRPDGFNIGINLGAAGGAGVRGHIHVHIVPRWVGDTNFMPVLAGTKVVSESLESVYRRLTQCSTDKRSKKRK
ncbi:MAG: HIT domain-containing protein [Candidatus Omnitrophica bacterium]|nr:HIT domain-containing protein [Candidatus Omnitrophota bacterium]